MAPIEIGASYIEPQSTYKPIEAAGLGDVSEATFTPLGRVVILVLPGSTESGSGGGSVTPSRGKSSGGTE